MALIKKFTYNLLGEYCEPPTVERISPTGSVVMHQTLTEYGICYTTNNYLAYNMSTRF